MVAIKTHRVLAAGGDDGNSGDSMAISNCALPFRPGRLGASTLPVTAQVFNEVRAAQWPAGSHMQLNHLRVFVTPFRSSCFARELRHQLEVASLSDPNFSRTKCPLGAAPAKQEVAPFPVGAPPRCEWLGPLPVLFAAF